MYAKEEILCSISGFGGNFLKNETVGLNYDRGQVICQQTEVGRLSQAWDTHARKLGDLKQHDENSKSLTVCNT